jgi:hypothetical protein
MWGNDEDQLLDESTPTVKENSEWGGIIGYISGFWSGNPEPPPDILSKLEKPLTYDGTPKPGLIQRVFDTSNSYPHTPDVIDVREPPSPDVTPKFQVSVVFDENLDEEKLLQAINSVKSNLSIKTTEHIGHYSPTLKPKLLPETPKKNILLDNMKPVTPSVSTLKSPIIGLKDLDVVSETRISTFRSLLMEDDVDLNKLTQLSWSGIPQEVRSQVWKLLTGYLSCNKTRREKNLERKRREYFENVEKYFDNSVKKTNVENGQWIQIQKDSIRTHPDIFRQDRMREALERILYVWALRHPASGYVQGMNDLTTPFMILFLTDYVEGDVFTCDTNIIDESNFREIEADTYWCFTFFVNFIQDHYTFAQPGIQRMVHKLEEIITKIDPELHHHLMEEKLEYMQFTLRWMNCLLMREIPLRLCIRLFDTYLAEGSTSTSFSSLHTYVCAAFLKTWSSKLMKMDNSIFGHSI